MSALAFKEADLGGEAASLTLFSVSCQLTLACRGPQANNSTKCGQNFNTLGISLTFHTECPILQRLPWNVCIYLIANPSGKDLTRIGTVNVR